MDFTAAPVEDPVVETGLSASCLARLLTFEGYGPTKPKIIFLGIEEKVDEPGISVNLLTLVNTLTAVRGT